MFLCLNAAWTSAKLLKFLIMSHYNKSPTKTVQYDYSRVNTIFSPARTLLPQNLESDALTGVEDAKVVGEFEQVFFNCKESLTKRF